MCRRVASARPPPVNVLVFIALASVFVAPACHESFRFDEHDATATTDVASRADAGTATAWTGIETCASTCVLSCPGPRACASSCAGACTAVCPAGSDCTLTAGRDTTVTCESARCYVNILDRSMLHCLGTSSCDLICPRDCGLECAPTARCTIQCRTDSAPRAVTGSVSCSDG